ncbi:MAG TPA: Grx4 family monothiol glutaredoxin [Candidatus Binataceae bacterium]|jgi:monothiol glutaredoxin|nr:Grx4 family monothiol glutaredoxin [Candidatus Binataceae bacterium]
MANALERIKSAVADNRIMIFMKGNRNFPQCGFSAATVQIFEQLGAPYETMDVLSDPEVRDQVKAFSNWPTIPQVYIDGKFVGGCDIVRELYETGELQTMVKSANGQAAAH